MSRGPERELGSLEATLGYRFADPELLRTALTHRSRSHEVAEGGSHYERLEFLGDALLGLLVADWLYRRDPTASEGRLSRRRQSIVRTGTLAAAARRLQLGPAMRLGRGEERTGGREKPTLLADAFEAVVGAVYLDGGMRSARAFVRRHLLGPLADEVAVSGEGDDYKTRLQEALQARWRVTPTYRIVSKVGPAHAARFEVEVQAGGRTLERGGGASRKEAEQNAARQALLALEGEETEVEER